MVRIIPFFIYLWVIAAYEVILKDVFSIWGVAFNLTILIVLLTAFYKSELTTIWFSFFVGLVAHISSGQVLGLHILLLCLLGVVAFHLKEKLNLDSLIARLLLILGGSFIYGIIILIIGGTDGWIEILLTKIIPGAVYTTLIGWLFFLFKEDKLTLKKIKSVF